MPLLREVTKENCSGPGEIGSLLEAIAIENFPRIVRTLEYGQVMDDCIHVCLLSVEQLENIQDEKSETSQARALLLALLADTEALKRFVKEILEEKPDDYGHLIYLFTKYDPGGLWEKKFLFEEICEKAIRPFYAKLVRLLALEIRDGFDPSEPLENIYNKPSSVFQRLEKTGIKMDNQWKEIICSLPHFPQAVALLRKTSKKCATRELIACIKEGLEERLNSNTQSSADVKCATRELTACIKEGLEEKLNSNTQSSADVKCATRELTACIKEGLEEKLNSNTQSSADVTELSTRLNLLSEIEAQVELISQAPPSVVELPEAEVSFVQGVLKKVMEGMETLKRIPQEREAALKAVQEEMLEKTYLEEKALADEYVSEGAEMLRRMNLKFLVDYCHRFKGFPGRFKDLWLLNCSLEFARRLVEIVDVRSRDQVRDLCAAVRDSGQIGVISKYRNPDRKKYYKTECKKILSIWGPLGNLIYSTDEFVCWAYSKEMISPYDRESVLEMSSALTHKKATVFLASVERGLWSGNDGASSNDLLIILKESGQDRAYRFLKNGCKDDRAERFGENFTKNSLRLMDLFRLENGSSVSCLFEVLDRLSGAGVVSGWLVDETKREQLTGSRRGTIRFFRDKIPRFCSFRQLCEFVEIIETTHPKFARALMTRDVKEYRAVHRTYLVAIRGENFLTREACQLAAIQLLDRELRAYKVPRQDREKRLIACQASLDDSEQRQKREEYLVSYQRYLGNRTPGFFSSATIAALAVRKAEEPSSEEPETKRSTYGVR